MPLRFECHIVEHCNLNCAGCSHFSCLAEPEFLALTHFTADLRRMRELLPDAEIARIGLLGGEPLLHPEFAQFVETAHSVFPGIPRYVITNGTLLTEEQLQLLAKYNTIIWLSEYPLTDNTKLKKQIQAHNIPLVLWPKHRMRKDVMDFKGQQDPEYQFSKCRFRLGAGSCQQLYKGQLFPCPKAAFARHLSTFFHLNLPQQQGLDIYSINSKAEIYEFLNKPLDFCRYCRQDIQWEVDFNLTEYKLAEWS